MTVLSCDVSRGLEDCSSVSMETWAERDLPQREEPGNMKRA